MEILKKKVEAIVTDRQTGFRGDQGTECLLIRKIVDIA